MALPNHQKFHTDFVRMEQLYDNDKLDACIELGEEMINDERIPMYIHIKALILLGTIMGHWEDAEKKRIEAELMFWLARKLHHLADGEDINGLFAGLRTELNLLESQLELEKPEHYDARAAVLQARENRHASSQARSDDGDDQTYGDDSEHDQIDDDQIDDDQIDDDLIDDDQIDECLIASSVSEVVSDAMSSVNKSAQIDNGQSLVTTAISSDGDSIRADYVPDRQVVNSHIDEVAVLSADGGNGMKNSNNVTECQAVDGQADKIAVSNANGNHGTNDTNSILKTQLVNDQSDENAMSTTNGDEGIRNANNGIRSQAINGHSNKVTVSSVHGVNGSRSTEKSNRIRLDNARIGSDNEVINGNTEPRGDESSQVVGKVDSVAAVQVSQLSMLFKKSTGGRPWWRNLPH